MTFVYFIQTGLNSSHLRISSQGFNISKKNEHQIEIQDLESSSNSFNTKLSFDFLARATHTSSQL